MFSITVAFGSMSAQLLFKTREAAINSHKNIEDLLPVAGFEIGKRLAMADDFGRSLIIPAGSFNGAIFEDMDVAKEGAIEYALHQARTQNAAQKRAMNDPVLKQPSVMGMGSPAMLNPMMGNGRFNG